MLLWIQLIAFHCSVFGGSKSLGIISGRRLIGVHRADKPQGRAHVHMFQAVLDAAPRLLPTAAAVQAGEMLSQ